MESPSYTITKSDGSYYMALHYPNGKNKIREIDERLAMLLSDGEPET